MKMPEGYSEAEVLKIIDKTANILSRGFVFGYFSLDDIKQQARLYGLQSLSKYDNKRPLANFIYACVLSRLINFKRDMLRRTDSPCKECAAGMYCGESNKPCDKYVAWRKRNDDKANILKPVGISSLPEESEHHEDDIVYDIEVKELLELIDVHLPIHMREDFLKIKHGVTVPKHKRMEIEAMIRSILKEDCE